MNARIRLVSQVLAAGLLALAGCKEAPAPAPSPAVPPAAPPAAPVSTPALAFTQRVDGDLQLFVADENGEHRRLLYAEAKGANVLCPEWTKDGKAVDVSVRRGEALKRLRVHLDGHTEELGDAEPCVTHFTRADDLKLHDGVLKAGDVVLYDAGPLYDDKVNELAEADWTPAHDQVLFHSFGPLKGSHLLLVNADGSHLRDLGAGRTPRWNPSVTVAKPTGKWMLDTLEGASIAAGRTTPFVEFGAGTVGGRAGCNDFSGAMRLHGHDVAFGRLSLTEKVCDPAAMKFEILVTENLARSASFTVAGPSLTLADANGRVLSTWKQ